MTERGRMIAAGLTAAAARRRRLAKVEALARAAGTTGEAEAAVRAAGRVRLALTAVPGEAPAPHADADRIFALASAWSGRLLAALCRRYGIEPLDDGRDGTMTVRAPGVFLDTVLAPEFAEVERSLAGLMAELAAPVTTTTQ